MNEPASLLLLADSVGSSSYRIHSTWNSGYHIDPRHNDGANIGFCDGHAKWYSVRSNSNVIPGVTWLP